MVRVDGEGAEGSDDEGGELEDLGDYTEENVEAFDARYRGENGELRLDVLTKEWDAKITEQIPDKRIAWTSTSGVHNAGVVTFHKISDSCTRIMLQMSYTPEGPMEKLGDMVGAVRMEARKNLESFKRLIEARRHETGAWRGSVTQH